MRHVGENSDATGTRPPGPGIVLPYVGANLDAAMICLIRLLALFYLVV